MLRNSGRILAAIVLLTLSASTGFAQYADLTRGKVIKGEEARELAVKKGWVIRKQTASGLIELKAVVNGIPQYYITQNADAADTISTDECLPGGSTGYNLTGYDVNLGIWDGGGVLTSHQEFGGRATQIDSPTGTHYHSTHVAGTMIASGVVPDAMGMSPAATLDCYDWDDDTTEMRSAAQNGLLVSNHSYGSIRGWYYDYFGDGNWLWLGNYSVDSYEDYAFGLYTSDSQEHDDIAFDNPQYLIVKSAGNDRNDDGPGAGAGHWIVDWNTGYPQWSYDTHKPDGEYDCVGPVAAAKNVLAVGAVYDIYGGYYGSGSVGIADFSSYGPTDDGRIKPDIVANGVGLYSTFDGSNSDYYSIGGTSMSSPNVSGSLGLLIQHWRNTHVGSSDMRSATLKGLVLHTADESGSANGPDYEHGWGLMNTKKAAQVIFADVTDPLTISEQTIANGENRKLVVTAGTGELRASICWTDPPGTPPGYYLDPTTKMLVNDLDLRLVNTGSATTYYPWVLDPTNPTSVATTGDNNTDNVEQIVIYSPASATYSLTVTHKGSLYGGSQNFSLIITGATSISTVECDDDGDCDDNNACNGTETCSGGTCQDGTPLVCDDDNPCTDDSCVPATGCHFVDDNSNSCDDGNLCNGNEFCWGGDCQDGTPLVCDDDNPCTDDSCVPATGCHFVDDNSNSCDDGNLCNGSEFCLGGDCQDGTPLVCDDDNPCTDDSCVPATGCHFVDDNSNSCDDGNLCNGSEFCLGGDCQDGTPLVCDDDNPCTDDSCVPATGCDYQADDTNTCEDGIDCTDDACQSGTCVSLPNDVNCSDDSVFCNGPEVCDAMVGCISAGDPCDSATWCDESLDVCEPYGDGDFDGDGDVDLQDFARFQLCFAQSASGGCEPANMTGDEMVDLDDYNLISPLITGP